MESSNFGRLVSVLLAPTKTFRAIAERPTWVVALVFMLVIAVAVTVVIMPRMDFDAVMRAQMEQQDRQVSEDQMTQGIEMMEKFGFVFAIIGIVFAAMSYLIVSGVFLLGTRLMGGAMNFKEALSVTLHGMMPRAVMGILTIPVVMSQETLSVEAVQTGSFLSSNLGQLAPEGSSQALVTLLSSLDLFTIWTLVLLVIGVGVVGKLKRGASIVVVVGSWLVWVLVKTGWAALSGAFGG